MHVSLHSSAWHVSDSLPPTLAALCLVLCSPCTDSPGDCLSRVACEYFGTLRPDPCSNLHDHTLLYWISGPRAKKWTLGPNLTKMTSLSVHFCTSHTSLSFAPVLIAVLDRPAESPAICLCCTAVNPLSASPPHHPGTSARPLNCTPPEKIQHSQDVHRMQRTFRHLGCQVGTDLVSMTRPSRCKDIRGICLFLVPHRTTVWPIGCQRQALTTVSLGLLRSPRSSS